MIRRLWSSANLVLAFLIAVPIAWLAQARVAVTASGPVQGLEANGINIFRRTPLGVSRAGARRSPPKHGLRSGGPQLQAHPIFARVACHSKLAVAQANWTRIVWV